jgi:P4 family phage/plasmid primase-like protien
MRGETSLDLSRLEKVKHLEDGSIRAACPACRAAGSDKSGNHLKIEPNGKFGCATHKDDGEHRKEIYRLAGKRHSPVPSRPMNATTPAKPRIVATGEIFNWQKCVAAFLEADAQKLAAWRGLSVEFVRWIHAQGIVGIFDGKISFANHGDGGKVVSAHVRLANGKWIFDPKGQQTAPLIFGNAKSAAYVLTFESQWDAFAVMDKLGWHTANGLLDTAVLITRGAGNGKLIRGQIAPDSVCCAFKQNDAPTAKKPIPAGDIWLTDVASHAGCKVLNVTTPTPHKDVNDWTRAGATNADLKAAMKSAPEWIPAIVSDTTETNTPAQWFAEKFPSLPSEYGTAISEETDKDGIVNAKDIGEDFFAATLGDKGSPHAPTVFVPTEQKFYTYLPGEGVFVFQSEPVLTACLSRLLLECARVCRDGCETKTLEFRFRDTANLSGVLKKARGLLAVPHDYFASDLTKFIPCANGMLRLDDKTLLPFSPDYRRRNKLAVRFVAAAKCPLFLDTLMRAALDDEDLDLLQRWCGLALIGENLAQRILILTGTAGGGKGTFIRVLNGIIGEINLASLRTHLLGERFETSRFLGKTLLYGADVPEDFLNQRGASVLKSLTGYDPVTLEFKNSNESPSIICKFNVIVTCNSRLTVKLEGDTDAWRRRLAIIEYHKPKPEKVIADLDKQILANEASGVLNWMLAGLDKLRADGWQLNLTDQQQKRVDNLLLESDGHTVFVRECLTRDAEGQLTVPDCFAAYVEFCDQRGWTALTKNKFGKLIEDVVVRQFRITSRNDIKDGSGKAQRGWKGIRRL